MNTIGYISASVLGGILVIWISNEVASAFVIDFLRLNLLLLLPALMAINVTTCGVVMTKLKELGDKYKTSFSEAISEMKKSFHEQTALMVVAALLLIADGAHGVTWLGSADIRHNARFAVESLICACFIFALFILHDTAKSIFVILKFEDEQNKRS
jgi:hypothetical protein